MFFFFDFEHVFSCWIYTFDFFQGAIIGINDEDDSTFTITCDHRTFHFQGKIDICFSKKFKKINNDMVLHNFQRWLSCNVREKFI